MPKRNLSGHLQPEVVDLTQDEEQPADEQGVLRPQPLGRVVQRPSTSRQAVRTLNQEMVDLTGNINRFVPFPPTNGRRPLRLLVAESPVPDVQPQQQQQQPQPGPSGVEIRYPTEYHSSTHTETDTDSDSPYVNLGNGKQCHISRWVKYVDDLDFDIYGPDAMEEYFSNEDEAETAQPDPEGPASKRKK